MNIADLQRKFLSRMTVEEQHRWADAELEIRISDLRNAKADEFSIDRAIKAAQIRRHWIMATPQQTNALVQQAARRKRERGRVTREAA